MFNLGEKRVHTELRREWRPPLGAATKWYTFKVSNHDSPNQILPESLKGFKFILLYNTVTKVDKTLENVGKVIWIDK